MFSNQLNVMSGIFDKESPTREEGKQKSHSPERTLQPVMGSDMKKVRDLIRDDGLSMREKRV